MIPPRCRSLSALPERRTGNIIDPTGHHGGAGRLRSRGRQPGYTADACKKSPEPPRGCLHSCNPARSAVPASQPRHLPLRRRGEFSLSPEGWVSFPCRQRINLPCRPPAGVARVSPRGRRAPPANPGARGGLARTGLPRSRAALPAFAQFPLPVCLTRGGRSAPHRVGVVRFRHLRNSRWRVCLTRGVRSDTGGADTVRFRSLRSSRSRVYRTEGVRSDTRRADTVLFRSLRSSRSRIRLTRGVRSDIRRTATVRSRSLRSSRYRLVSRKEGGSAPGRAGAVEFPTFPTFASRCTPEFGSAYEAPELRRLRKTPEDPGRSLNGCQVFVLQRETGDCGAPETPEAEDGATHRRAFPQFAVHQESWRGPAGGSPAQVREKRSAW